MSMISRRAALRCLGLAGLAPFASRSLRAGDAKPAATTAASQLPLHTTGLEHLGVVVPDVEAAGRFYGRLFNPELYKEKDPPLRYYVPLGVGYLAFGSRTVARHAFFDHFCALVENYDTEAMVAQLQSLGLPAAHYGIVADPDAIGLQLLGTPGGLAPTTVPAGRIVEGAALVKPRRLRRVELRVANLDRSLQFYRIFFGPETHSSGGHALFRVADTQLALRVVSGDESPQVDRIVVECEPFDRDSVGRALAGLGARVATGRGRALGFTDPVGLGLELQSV